MESPEPDQQDQRQTSKGVPPMPESTLLHEAKELFPQLAGYRESLHQIPETDLELPQTSAFVQDQLSALGIEHTTLVDGNCVVATVGSGKPCIMLRADMDALPIVEDSGETFASTNGNMHACGHDLHASALLGAAALLKRHESELAGTVKLLFQPGEETFHGAQAAIDDGLLENPHVDAAFGMHSASQVPVGVVLYGTQCMTAVYGFRITVNGRGGHGSNPGECIDPISAAIQIHLALQELMSREKSPFDEASLTIGSFHAGSASNIIPNQAVMEGTMRVFNPEARAFLIKRINEIVPAVGAAYRTTATVETIIDVPPTINDEDMLSDVLGYLGDDLPEITLADKFHVMPSEDFALYGERIPTVYLMAGAKPDDVDYPLPHHNAKVRFSSDEIPFAAAAYASVALRWLADHAGKEE